MYTENKQWYLVQPRCNHGSTTTYKTRASAVHLPCVCRALAAWISAQRMHGISILHASFYHLLFN